MNEKVHYCTTHFLRMNETDLDNVTEERSNISEKKELIYSRAIESVIQQSRATIFPILKDCPEQ